MSIYHKIVNNLNENKEDWYSTCNEAEQALFKVKNACSDETACKALDRMILELNNIRMEQYSALNEYALVETINTYFHGNNEELLNAALKDKVPFKIDNGKAYMLIYKVHSAISMSASHNYSAEIARDPYKYGSFEAYAIDENERPIITDNKEERYLFTEAHYNEALEILDRERTR